MRAECVNELERLSGWVCVPGKVKGVGRLFLDVGLVLERQGDDEEESDGESVYNVSSEGEDDEGYYDSEDDEPVVVYTADENETASKRTWTARTRDSGISTASGDSGVEWGSPTLRSTSGNDGVEP